MQVTLASDYFPYYVARMGFYTGITFLTKKKREKTSYCSLVGVTSLTCSSFANGKVVVRVLKSFVERYCLISLLSLHPEISLLLP